MRLFTMTAGVLFALIVAVHLWRIAEEGTALLRQPFFVGATLAAGAMAWWAFRVASRAPRA
jgi:hypothetical protein